MSSYLSMQEGCELLRKEHRFYSQTDPALNFVAAFNLCVGRKVTEFFYTSVLLSENGNKMNIEYTVLL